MLHESDYDRIAERRRELRSMRRQLADLAKASARAADIFADTLDRVARSRPADAERLHHKAAAARRYAAQERQLATAYLSSPDI